MKTKTNPRGSGRKPRETPGKQVTLILEQDLYDWLEGLRRQGILKSDIANSALRELKDKVDFTIDKSIKSGHNKKAAG